MSLLASNAFYSFYFAHVRMYPLLVLGSAVLLWLYLRIIYHRKAVKFRDYFALFASSYALVNIHVFSSLFFIAMGIYHLVAPSKNRRWTFVCLTFIVAFLLFLPWLYVLTTYGIDLTFEQWDRGSQSIWHILEAWLITSNNGSILLLLVSLIGMVVERRNSAFGLRPYYFIVWVFLLVLGLVAQFSDLLSTNSMRLTLAALPPLVLALSASLYVLFRVRRWLGILVLLSWVFGGHPAESDGGLDSICVVGRQPI